MRRRLPALVGAILVAGSTIALGLVGATAAGAAVAGPADIEIGADAATGKVGEQMFVHLHVINHGPGNVATGWMTYDYQAPAGAELVGVAPITTRRVEDLPFACTWPTAKTHARCPLQANLFYQQGDHGDADYGFFLVLRITRTITAPGRFGMTCADPQCSDPKTSNNAAKIVVNGVSSTVKPTPSPGRSGSVPGLPGAGSSAPVDASASASPAGSASSTGATPVDLAATPDLRTVGQTRSGVTIALVGGLAVVVMAALGGAIWYRRSRRPSA